MSPVSRVFVIAGLSLFAILMGPVSSMGAVPKATPNWKQEIEKPVRVRLATSLNKIVLQGFGLKVQGQVGPYQPVAVGRMGTLEIDRVKTEVGWFWRIKKTEAGSEKFELKKATSLVVEGNELRKGTQDLPERLVLTSLYKGFDLVGVLAIENYLVGVLSSEMPLTWPMEALKSQAVAARSYTLAVMRERRHLHYDVESTILDQVFNHVSRRLDSDKMIGKARRAVEETTGVVLLNQKSQVAKAFY
ncbi:MAG: SpoIID/LytB domain-containing protein, partial [Bdellovibrio sp.]